MRRAASAAALVAVVLGLGNAAVSAYWAAGGTALLDTVGGDIERWGQERGWTVVIGLAAIAVLKTGIALAAPVVAGLPPSLPQWARTRIPRALSWIAATALTLYGGVLTAVGLLVQADVIAPAADSDSRALAWHAYLWDPWFLAWGAAFLVCLRLTRVRNA